MSLERQLSRFPQNATARSGCQPMYPGRKHPRGERSGVLPGLEPRVAPRPVRAFSGGSSVIRDLATEGLEGDCVWLGAAATAGVQVVDRGQLVGGQLEVETLMFSAMRLGLVDFGITERPCCRPQRSITWAGLLPWAVAMSPMTGSLRVLPWLPSR